MPAPKKIPTPPAPPEAKDAAYYLTLFKLEGHATWRIHLGGKKESFETEKANWPKGKNAPKLLEANVVRFNRVTGFFDEVKPLK